jgi:hypothetical protein
MEVYNTLNEVVEILMDQGYLIDFKCVYETSFKDNWPMPEDFKIDSLYMVNDDDENGQHLLVVAISSKTLKTKTILVSTLVQYDDQPIYNELYAFVRQFIGRLLKLKQFK